MRRFLKAVGLVSLASLITYLLDPDRGRARRARLADQLAAKGRDVSDAVSAKARYQKGVVEGVAHEVATAFAEEAVYDDATLLQKVRSEAMGPSGVDTDHVEVDIRDGNVRLTGAVSDAAARRRLVDFVGKVDGVRGINDTLTTTS
ncbi:MAG TPA: BON domain-containing protein [Acidimicrobiia bacterium]